MKIIIVGAGRIGKNLARALSDEDNEVYLIEKNEDIGRKIADKLDIKVIVGNGADPDTLHKASIEEADLVLAVTTSDETNLVVCSLAAMLGAKRRIARVRNTALSTILQFSEDNIFKIDEIINPELVAAQTIVKTIETPGASEVADFADGRLLLRGFDISETSSMCGMKMVDFSDEDFPWPFLIVSIVRNETVLIPKGDTSIEAGDLIYALLPDQSLAEFLSFVDPKVKKAKKVVIYGATIIGKEVARSLSKKMRDIILLEEDPEKAREVAGELTDVRVINGSPSDTEIMIECGMEATDAFIATSDNDHSNLISAVLAKKLGATETIISTEQPDYLAIVHDLDIDAIVNPHHAAVEQILHLVRGKGINTVARMLECDAEALEFVTEEESPITKDVLKNLKFPKHCIVGAVYGSDGLSLANGETHVKVGDKVIAFCQQSEIKKFQKMFSR